MSQCRSLPKCRIIVLERAAILIPNGTSSKIPCFAPSRPSLAGKRTHTCTHARGRGVGCTAAGVHLRAVESLSERRSIGARRNVSSPRRSRDQREAMVGRIRLLIYSLRFRKISTGSGWRGENGARAGGRGAVRGTYSSRRELETPAAMV